MLICAAALMILSTYETFCNENSRAFNVSKLILTAAFSVLTGSFIGFAAFALLHSLKVHIRILIGVLTFAAADILIFTPYEPAYMVIDGIFIIVEILVVSLIFYASEFYNSQKEQKSERVMAANISEMHEKRLNKDLMYQNLLAEKNARLIERENISRNIHNSVGHSITAAIMTLDAADMLYEVKPDAARKKMNEANERIRGSLESIRRAVRVLDNESKVISASDLKSNMENIINEFVMDTRIIVNRSFVQLPDGVKIPHDDAEFLTGMLQEMLTNGVKHGNADEFFVFLSGDTLHIRFEISDNGKSSFNSENAEKLIKNGFGLKKIISYVGKKGGETCFVNSGGFKGTAEFPIIITDTDCE